MLSSAKKGSMSVTGSVAPFLGPRLLAVNKKFVCVMTWRPKR